MKTKNLSNRNDESFFLAISTIPVILILSGFDEVFGCRPDPHRDVTRCHGHSVFGEFHGQGDNVETNIIN
jgi:hypothetical protein